MAELLRHLGLKAEHVAVELNRDLVARTRHADRVIVDGDVLEVVTLVGGGAAAPIPIEPLSIGTHVVRSRLFVGTGKYATLEQMRDCLEASGAEVVTVAVRRERLFDREGRNLLDYLDPRKYTILPNTAGCFSAEDALRTARLGRELLVGLENPGARLGEAGSPGRFANALARPGGHSRGDPSPGQGRFSGSLLYERRPGDGPPAQGGRRDKRHARRQPDRQRPGRAQSQQYPDHSRGLEKW